MTEEELAAWGKYKAEAKERYFKTAAWLAERVARQWPACTAGDLRRRLEGVPDDAPVLYQRIEDSYFDTPDNGWETVSLIWEQEDHYSEYIPAFSAHRHKTADGREVFVVNAHY